MNDLEVKEQKSYGRGIGKVRGRIKGRENLVLAEVCVSWGIKGSSSWNKKGVWEASGS